MTPPSNITKYVIASPHLNKINHVFFSNLNIFVTGQSQIGCLLRFTALKNKEINYKCNQ